MLAHSDTIAENLSRGCGWIRTTEVERQQIYSLPHLATLEHTQFFFKKFQVSSFSWRGRLRTRTTFTFSISLFQSSHFFLSLLSDSNQRPRDYKSRALAN